ncbi:hypothetical protein CLV35_1319 [Motilibacter peucedani]|uniref:Uncharacterized protein n=1 Tax=Motilibacter peucedani TaxID=598650 RepID=A0A420XRV7_9ACTN|nr:hypothetical protein [Motilibacter peucedani]RKS77625.1 hypothetical protein CLV35_1319 [Motilibacter peucedani]
MGEFVRGLHERVAETARSLEAARAAGDDYAVELHSAELADLTRLAAEHGVDVVDLRTRDLRTVEVTGLDERPVAESA